MLSRLGDGVSPQGPPPRIPAQPRAVRLAADHLLRCSQPLLILSSHVSPPSDHVTTSHLLPRPTQLSGGKAESVLASTLPHLPSVPRDLRRLLTHSSLPSWTVGTSSVAPHPGASGTCVGLS